MKIFPNLQYPLVNNLTATFYSTRVKHAAMKLCKIACNGMDVLSFNGQLQIMIMMTMGGGGGVRIKFSL